MVRATGRYRWEIAARASTRASTFLRRTGCRLADHADHATVDSSRIYTVDTVGERAANSVLIASAFQGRL